MNDKDGGEDRKVAKLFGALLMAVGGLIAGLSGLCSAGVAVMSLSGGGNAFAGMLVLVAMVGGPSIAVGAGLFFWGRALWRGPKS